MKEEKLNDVLKMKEWSTIIPSENISKESIIEPIRLPLINDHNWVVFGLLQ